MIEKKNALIALRDSYTSGLYLFGFLKVAKGLPLEKAFWLVSMLLILSFTTVMIYRKGKRYAAYGVSAKLWEEDTLERK